MTRYEDTQPISFNAFSGDVIPNRDDPRTESHTRTLLMNEDQAKKVWEEVPHDLKMKFAIKGLHEDQDGALDDLAKLEEKLKKKRKSKERIKATLQELLRVRMLFAGFKVSECDRCKSD